MVMSEYLCSSKFRKKLTSTLVMCFFRIFFLNGELPNSWKSKSIMLLIICTATINLCANNNELIIFSFTAGKNFDLWRCSGGVKQKYAAWPDHFPGASTKITFTKTQLKPKEYAAIKLDLSPNQRDWSKGSTIEFDVYSNHNQTLGIICHDGEGKSIDLGRFEYKLNRGKIRIPVSLTQWSKKRAMNLSIMKSLEIYFQNTKYDNFLQIGDIKLVLRDVTSEFALIIKMLEAEKQDAELVAQTDRDKFHMLLKEACNLYNSGQISAEKCDYFRREADKLKAKIQFCAFKKKTVGSNTFAAAWVSGLEKVFRDNHLFQNEPQNKLQLFSAKGEWENAQIVVLPFEEISNLHVSISKIPENTAGDIINSENIKINPVGYVFCKKQSAYDVPRTGYWPDPILNYTKIFTLEKEKFQPYFFEIYIPKNQPPGTYQGSISLCDSHKSTMELPFEITVHRFAIGDEQPYEMINALSPFTLTAPHRSTSDFKSWRRDMWKMMSEHRMNGSIDVLYRTEPPSVDDVKDAIMHGAKSFNVIYSVGRKGELEKIDQAMKLYKQHNLDKYAYVYGYDEAVGKRIGFMKEHFAKIKKAHPDLPLVTTAVENSCGIDTGNEDTVDCWLPLVNRYESMGNAIKSARSRGKKVGWYICCWPAKPYPNIFIEHPAMSARMFMGVMAWKYKPDMFIYYCVNSWRDFENGKWEMRNGPMTGAPLTNYTGNSFREFNGDGLLIYPGKDYPVASLRLKYFRDGVEDALYFRQLQKALNNSSMMPERWRSAAKKALVVEEKMVKSLAEYTLDSKLLLRKRLEIAGLLNEYIINCQYSNLNP